MREPCAVLGRGTRLALAAALGLALACRGDAPPERIVLVSIDTLRADHVGAYGAARAHTPTLDRLAADGVRFDPALSPAPLTLPSHATLLTGLDPDRHGVRHNSVFALPGDVPTLAERLRAAGYATGAFVGAFVLDRRFGLARGFDVYDDRLGERRSGDLVGFAERPAGEVVDAFLAWAGQAPPRFFAWVHFYDPHAGYDPPAGFSMAFPGDPYAGEIAYADAQLGRLLDGLAKRFDPRGTLVVVTSDHGESLGEHGEPTHSYGVYEATQRVPLILAGPGFSGGRVAPGPVRLADVAPTLLAAAGATPLPEATGRDLRRRGDGAEPPPAYSETLATHLDFGWSALFAARTERWKYLRAPRPELYDLSADPGERENVVAAHPETARALDGWLAERLARARPLAGPGAALSGEDRARLEALGYVVPGAAAVADGDLSGPDPKDGVALLDALSRADALAGRGRHADAFGLLAELPAAGPMFAAVRAAHAVNAGQGAAAEREIRAALAAEPERADYLMILGRALESQRQLEAAAEAYRRAAEGDPRLAAPWIGLGRLQEAAQQPAEAERSYRNALERAAADPEAAWHLAALRMEAGDLAGGRALLARAGEAPSMLLALRVAAQELEAGDPDAAAGRVERAASGPEPPDPLPGLAAAVLEAGGRLDAALRLRELALSRAPDDWPRQNEVAWTLALQGRDLDRALVLAEAAVAASRGVPATLDTLATVRWKRGELREALAAVDRALARTGSKPEDAELRAHLRLVRDAALAGSSPGVDHPPGVNP